MRLHGKVAIVTGAASGFGEGIARRYAEEGACVVVADLNKSGAERVADEIGQSAVPCQVDVSDGPQTQAMVDLALSVFDRLDIVVNNAGTTHRNQPLLETNEAAFDRVYAVNVKSVYWSAQASVPVFRKLGGGVIVNVASTAGMRPRPGLAWYNGSKGAVITISKTMAVELAPDNIRVNALCPVIGETALLGEFMGVPDTPENRAKFVSTIPMGRLSRPEDIAKAALYLASDDADFITGVALEVDGGRCV